MPVIIPPYDDCTHAVLCPQCGTRGELERDPVLAPPNNTTWYRCPNPRCPGALAVLGPYRWNALPLNAVR